MNPRKKRKLNNDKIRNIRDIIKKNNLLSFNYEEELNDIFEEYKDLCVKKLEIEELSEVKNILKSKKKKLKSIIKLAKYILHNEYEYVKDLLLILEKIY